MWWGHGRQPRSLEELLADLTRRERGGELETRSGSSKSSASNARAQTGNPTIPRAPQAPALGVGILRPSAPVAVIGGTINPVIGRPGVPAQNNGIPGSGPIPPNGFPPVPTAPLLPLPRPPRPVVSPAPIPVAPAPAPARPAPISAAPAPPARPAPSSAAPAPPARPAPSSAAPAPPARPAPSSAAPPQPPRPPVSSQPPVAPPLPPVAPSQPAREPVATPSQTPSQTRSQPQPTSPPVMAPVQPQRPPPVSSASPPPAENAPISSQIPAPPSVTSMLTATGGAAAPTESAVAPGREASMAGRPANNSSRQVAILAGSILGAMLLAGLMAMLCIRKNKKDRKVRQGGAGSPHKHEKSGSLSGPISYPVPSNNPGPWAPPLRKQTDASWPMGQSNNRNSMEDGPVDNKQYLAYQNLVGNANNQIQPPPAAGSQSQATRARDSRYLSASSADPYEQINGRYSEWPPVPAVPNAGAAGGAQNQASVPIGYAQTPAQQSQTRNLEQYPQLARINQHYSLAERAMLSPSYHQAGAQRASVAPPSPLFFKLDQQGNLGPESRR